ncbi:MAG: hypothetical protein EPN84_11835 [Legionella sp.]|nr:MAG: hypothetical protein EPN84_11835 [Legionella sp.]
MTNLEKLIEALATVIIRYHDSQVSEENRKVVVPHATTEILRFKSREFASEIIKTLDFDNALTDIKNDVVKAAEYKMRSHLLEYLIAQIKYLKKFKDAKEPLSADALKKYESHIGQLFYDLAKLIITHKTSTYNVTYPPVDGRTTKLALNGLIYNGYVSNKPCTSGVFLSEEVTKPFDLDAEYSLKEMQEKAQQICEEYQNTLIIPKLNTQLTSLQIDFEVLRIRLNESESKVSTSTAQVTTLTEKNEDAIGKLAEAQRLVEEKASEIEELKKRNQSLNQGVYGAASGFLLFKRVYRPVGDTLGAVNSQTIAFSDAEVGAAGIEADGPG